MTTWKQLIDKEAKDDTIIYCTLTEDELNKEFYDSYGLSEGEAFTAWSEEYVYFPVVYDGKEWVGRVPRNPCDKPSEHFGGE